MKVFWGFIFVLTVFTAGLVAMRRGDGGSAAPADTGAAAGRQAAPPSPDDAGATVPQAVAARHEAVERGAPVDASPVEATGLPIAPVVDRVVAIPEPVAVVPGEVPAAVDDDGDAPSVLVVGSSGDTWADDPGEVSDVLNELLGLDPVAVAIAEAAGVEEAGAGDEASAGAATETGRFEVPGSGTREDPFVVDWRVLVSARETYNPRKGKTVIPSWVTALDGSVVTLDGFVLLPVMQTTTQEVLVMANEWDGCCIGVPPTPYDAIEVKLNAPTKKLSRVGISYGRVTGVLRVDPYLVKDWLVGLYVMDDAELGELGF